MKSKLLIIFFYVGIAWLGVIFIFGESGMLDNMAQTQEIKRLIKFRQQAQQELDDMNKEYQHLVNLSAPNEIFLIDQGRKSQDIVVFKSSTAYNSNKSMDFIHEKQLLLQIGIIVFIILIIGFIGIGTIAFLSRKKQPIILHKEEENGYL